MKTLLAILALLNLVDMGLTWLFLSAGVGEEMNPVMAAAWAHSPWTFAAVKIGMTAYACIVLWWARRRLAARVATAGITLFYAALVLAQLLHLEYLP